MPTIKCDNCNFDMIARKDYYECPCCHSKKDKNNLKEKKETMDYKKELIEYISKDKVEYNVLEKLIDNVICTNPNDPLSCLISSFINKNNSPEGLKQSINNFFNNDSEKNNYDIIVNFIINNSDYKFIVSLENCLKDNGLFGNYKDVINDKKNILEDEINRTSVLYADVFVCYSSNDIEIVKNTIDYIERDGINCWYADRNMPKNHPTDFDYKKRIESAISNCKVFLVIASKNSMYSSDVQWEIDCAIENGCNKKVEYVISPIKHIAKFKTFFNGIQWIDATEDEQYDVLVERINYLLTNSNDSNKENAENKLETSPIKEENAMNSYDEVADIVEKRVDNNENYKELGINHFENGEYDEALECLLKCKEDSIVNYYLGMIYYNPKLDLCDYDRAYEFIINSNDSRLFETSNDLGKKLFFGEDCKIDYEKAFKCFKKAADLGNDRAMYNVALCYSRGSGVEKDLGNAAHYYKKSADNGNVKAAYEYALLCLDENAGINLVDEGINYLNIAAVSGYADAQYELGVYYYNGKYVSKSINKSLKWLEKAISNGSTLAMKYKNNHFDNEYDNDDCALELDDLSDLDL